MTRAGSSDDFVLVVAAVIRRGDALLLGRRPPGKRHGGMWEFPGGKLLDEEGPEDAARRELKEELDLDLERIGPELLAVSDPGSAFSVRFHDADVSGTPKALEHTEIRWFVQEDLSTLELAPADAQFVRSHLHRNPLDASGPRG